MREEREHMPWHDAEHSEQAASAFLQAADLLAQASRSLPKHEPQAQHLWETQRRLRKYAMGWRTTK